MEQNEDRIPSIEEALVATPTEASLRLQVTDLLLSRLPDVRVSRISGGADLRATRRPGTNRSGARSP